MPRTHASQTHATQYTCHTCGARWDPLYTLPNSNRVVTVQPDTIDRDFRQYMGAIDTRPIDDSLIILANVGMTDTNCVNARA